MLLQVALGERYESACARGEAERDAAALRALKAAEIVSTAEADLVAARKTLDSLRARIERRREARVREEADFDQEEEAAAEQKRAVESQVEQSEAAARTRQELALHEQEVRI